LQELLPVLEPLSHITPTQDKIPMQSPEAAEPDLRFSALKQICRESLACVINISGLSETVMSHIKKIRAISLALACLMVLGSMVSFAQKQFKTAHGQPVVKVSLSGLVEREGERILVEKAAAVKPGEILDWTITSENQGSAAAHEYKAVGQIPRGTQLVAESVTYDGSASVVYSIDNGKTFSPQPTIEEKQEDGSMKQVAAPVSMYTQIRYEWADPLAEGSKLDVSYKVRVK
jgi:uncharacterized repeat protein (TIGR01451 family)